MTPDSSKTSSLLFGIQWDLVCKFLEVKSNLEVADINSDSGEWGNYSNVEIPIDNSEKSKKFPLDTWTWTTIQDIKPAFGQGTYVSILLSTGSSEKTNKVKIYDFAGNEAEWTLEHATAVTNSPCCFRGSGYNDNASSRPASWRGYNGTDVAHEGWGSFRPALY